MWWIHVSEGFALDSFLRGVQLGLAFARTADARIHLARVGGPWRALLSPQEGALLDQQVPTLEDKEAGLTRLMASAAKLLRSGDDPPIDYPEVTTSVLCVPGCAVPENTVARTWLVLTQLGTPTAPPRGYERSFAFAPWGSGGLPVGTQALPPAVDTAVFNGFGHVGAARDPCVLLIGQGDRTADAAMAERLALAGCPRVVLFDPYTEAPGEASPGVSASHNLDHVPSGPPQVRAAAFATCTAVLVVDNSPDADNQFMWEAVACGAEPLASHVDAGAATWDAASLAAACAAHRNRAPLRRRVQVVDWRDIAARITALPPLPAPPPAPRRPGAALLPRLVGFHASERSPLVKKKHLGINVATNLIWDGLEAAARGRFEMQWLAYQDPDGVRGRFYNYPEGDVSGRASAEFDYADLPGRLQRNEIEIMCSCDPVADDMAGARQVWANKAIPVVNMVHSLHGHGLTFYWLLQVLQYEVFAFDAVISPSRCGARAFEQMYAGCAQWLEAHTRIALPPPMRLDVVPYGINRAAWAGLHKPACRHALGLPQQAVLLLSLGRFNKREKADMLPLLMAAQELRQAGRPVILLLVGGAARPEYVQHLRDTAVALGLHDGVRFFDGASVEDKKLLLGAADIFVSISDNVQETYGLAIIEAMAAGLPVVASAWNGAREIVRPDETGFLVPTRWQPPTYEADLIARVGGGLMAYGNRDLHESVVVDNQMLTAHLSTLVAQPELRARMGRRAREVCAADYDLATQGRRMAELLLELHGMAARHPWKPDRSRAPIMAETQQRFGHYPSDKVSDDQPLRATRRAGDAIVRRKVLQAALDAGSPTEFALANRIIDLAEERPGATVGELSAALSGGTLSRERARLRVVRCWKYGLLERA